MSRIYIPSWIRFRRPVDRSELRDTITELQLENSLLRDELEACKELLTCKGNYVQQLMNKLRKADLKIEHLKLELAVANKSLDIVTENKEGETE